MHPKLEGAFISIQQSAHRARQLASCEGLHQVAAYAHALKDGGRNSFGKTRTEQNGKVGSYGQEVLGKGGSCHAGHDLVKDGKVKILGALHEKGQGFVRL